MLFFSVSLPNISQFPLISFREDFLNNWLLVCAICRWSMNNSGSPGCKNFPAHNTCCCCFKMLLGLWYNVLSSLDESGFFVLLGVMETSELYRCSYICLWNFVYFFPSTWLQFLNTFLFSLFKLLRKCVNISYHYFLSFYYIFFFHSGLWALFSARFSDSPGVISSSFLSHIQGKLGSPLY